jgi:hypothetical protein
MKFKAQITGYWHPSNNDGTTNKQLSKHYFTFTKYKIEFPKDFENETLHLMFYGACPFENNARYTISKELNLNDKQQFQITINKDCTAFLIINPINTIKCNIIHKRYWVQQNMDTFYKAIITIISSIASAAVAGVITYNLGFSSGLKEGQSKSKLEQQELLKQQSQKSLKINHPDSSTVK